MNINPLNSGQPLRPIRPAQQVRKKDLKAAGQASEGAGGLGLIQGLFAEMEAMPEVRPEMVELGRRLARYPSKEHLDKLAKLLLTPLEADEAGQDEKAG